MKLQSSTLYISICCITLYVGLQVPQECPAEIEQLIDLCLATEPSDRPTAKQAFDIISACSPTLAAPIFPADSQTRQQSITPPSHQVMAGHASDTEPQPNQSVLTGPFGLQLQRISAAEQGPHKESQQRSLSVPGKGYDAAQLSVHQRLDPQKSSANAQLEGTADLTQAQNSVSHQQAAPDRPVDSYVSIGQLQGLQHQSELQVPHPWRAASAGQAENDVPPDSMSDSLPLGVQGHLYPSPFAMAMDDGSGPLWSWPDASAAVQADVTSPLDAHSLRQ